MKIVKYNKQLQFDDDIELLEIKHDGERYFVQFHPSVENGFPSPAADFEGQKLSLDEHYLSHPESTYLVRAKGLSNFPTILPGDILIVRADLEIKSGDLGVFSFNNLKFTTKRLDQNNKRFISDNSSFKSINISDDDTVIALGKVHAIVRENLSPLK